MTKRWMMLAAASLIAAPAMAREPAIHPAVVSDPAPDAAYPAAMHAFVIPVQDGAMNALLYAAAGPGLHPTLLLLHGFPGNEQNLDLAQAARRAGWHVLTLHYRGSWGSPGAFSFTHAAQDAHGALAFLREPANVARYRIDTGAIVVAGHSMGGFMAADAVADDPRVAGLFLIDPWDPAQTVAALATPEGEAAWKEEVAGDLPPLAGASYDSLTAEIRGDGAHFDLGRRLVAMGRRPVSIIGAERGIAAMARKVAADAQAANPEAALMVWPTDHSFSDRRIALADALVRFLNRVAPTTLLQSSFNYQERGMATMLWTAALDDRYGRGRIASRIGLEAGAHLFDPDTDMLAAIAACHAEAPLSCVLIDEAQFLTQGQVWQLARVCDDLSIPVLCYGIRTDFQGALFEGAAMLLGLADTLTEIKTICECGRKATMNLRVDGQGRAVRQGEQTEIGGNDLYVALCRRHFVERIER